MNRKVTSTNFLPAALVLVTLCLSCQNKLQSRSPASENNLPHVILWAWERPENLEFINSQRFGVAFLAQTLTLKGNEVVLKPRRQPLKVSPETKLIAVTRIESQKTTGGRPNLSAEQRERLVALILKTMKQGNVLEIQVDFDAVTSERAFYRSLLEDLRQKLPEDVPLSMTALASFCLGDRWLNDLPVVEAVPMIFRMGTDEKPIKSFLVNGNDFREPLCRRSYGIAIDEPLEMTFDNSRRLFVFNVRSWTENDLASLEKRIHQ
jgi:hypothetical protein